MFLYPLFMRQIPLLYDFYDDDQNYFFSCIITSLQDLSIIHFPSLFFIVNCIGKFPLNTSSSSLLLFQHTISKIPIGYHLSIAQPSSKVYISFLHLYPVYFIYDKKRSNSILPITTTVMRIMSIDASWKSYVYIYSFSIIRE